MKISKEQYKTWKNAVDDRHIQLAEDLTDQLLDSMAWDEVDAQKLIALWLKFNSY